MDAEQQQEAESKLYNLYKTAQYVDNDMANRLKKALKDCCNLLDNSTREPNNELISIEF